MSATVDASDCLCRYYDQLGAMDNKLPMSEGQVSQSGGCIEGKSYWKSYRLDC